LEPTYGGFWRRYFALGIDAIICLIPLWVVLKLLSAPFLVSSLIYSLLNILYSVLFISMSGQTPGKRLLRLRVTSFDGTVANRRSVLLRYSPNLILFCTQAGLVLGVMLSLRGTGGTSDQDLLAATKQAPLGWLSTTLAFGWLSADIIVFLWNIGKKKRALHDVIAGTVVIVEPKAA
jgi:uncharacterized RDD family membrane protein YckC